MGIKLKIKNWLAKKLKGILFNEKPIIFISNNQIEVGKQSFNNGNFQIRGGGKKIKIGSYCAIGKDVKCILNNHDVDFASVQHSFYKNYFNEAPFSQVKQNISIEIGSDVWIGDNVIILPNITIGHGAVVGAASVVTKSIEPYSIVAGIPAKKIKNRFSDTQIKELLDLEWWSWSDSKIKDNKVFFFKNLNSKNGN